MTKYAWQEDIAQHIAYSRRLRRLPLIGNPVAHWNLDGVFTDYSGNSRPLNNQGTQRWLYDEPGFLVAQGSNIYSTNTALRIAGDVTATILFREHTELPVAASYPVMGWGSSYNTEVYNDLYYLFFNSLTGFEYRSESGAGVDTTFSAEFTIVPFAWHVVTIRRAGTVGSLWVNGVKRGEQTVTLPTGGTSGRFQILSRQDESPYQYYSYSGGASVHASALTDDQITYLAEYSLGVL